MLEIYGAPPRVSLPFGIPIPKKWVHTEAYLAIGIHPSVESTCTTMRTAIRFDLLVALFLLSPTFVSGQTDSRPCPDFLLTDADMSVELPALDVASAWLRAGREEAELGKHLYGVVQSGSADLAPAADTEVYVAAVRIANAMGVSLHFDDFHLPAGAEMWVTDLDGAWQEGPYDFRDNDDHGRMSTEDIPGEWAVVRLSVPAGLTGDVRLHIEGAAALFRDVAGVRGGSAPCEVDVACPEIQGWECQRDATVRLSIIENGGSYLCSGAMVNTTALDCRQYMLTALHCASNADDDDFALLKVYYNYERPECGEGNGLLNRRRTGVIRLADSDDIQGGNFQGSDFLLVEVEDAIPSSWDVYYAGWDASGSGSDSGVGIHHPSGDVKKISTYTQNTSSISLGDFGSHWRVYWVETVTDHGVTEGGSSGSHLFNEEGLSIGTLSAGLSACTNGGAGGGTGPNQPDYYGKMSFHWDDNPNPADEKLELWLDPEGTGQTVLHGAYPDQDAAVPCGPDQACEEVADVAQMTLSRELRVVPNPASDILHLRLSAGDWSDAAIITVRDAVGRIVATETWWGGAAMLDVSGWPRGWVLVTVTLSDGAQTTRRVVID